MEQISVYGYFYVAGTPFKVYTHVLMIYCMNYDVFVPREVVPSDRTPSH